MKKYRIYMPMVAVVLALMVFGLIVGKHNQHLAQGKIIYAKLAPVDPRSLLQGDYMRLGYELFFDYNENGYIEDIDKENSDKYTLYAKVTLDQDQKIVHTSLNLQDEGVLLQLKNPNRWLGSAYPATDSFMFAEGLAGCYDNAEYAKLSVLPDGQVMLVDLVNAELKSLGCEQQAQ